MKANSGKIAFAALFAAAIAVPTVLAADDLPDQSLSDYKVGAALRGDDIKKEDLEGRVVVIEYWGTR